MDSTSNNLSPWPNHNASPVSSTGSAPVKSPAFVEQSMEDLTDEVLENCTNIIEKLKKQCENFECLKEKDIEIFCDAKHVQQLTYTIMNAFFDNAKESYYSKLYGVEDIGYLKWSFLNYLDKVWHP